jgi:hypothetical protein
VSPRRGRVLARVGAVGRVVVTGEDIVVHVLIAVLPFALLVVLVVL